MAAPTDTALLSEKVHLYIKSAGTYIRVVGVDEFNPPDLQWTEIESTTRVNNRRKTFKKGMAEFPAFPVGVNYNPAEASHVAMDAALASTAYADFYTHFEEFDTDVYVQFFANVMSAPHATDKASIHKKTYQLRITGDVTSTTTVPT